MTRKMCCWLSAVALGSCVVSTRLHAQTADERVFFTFSAPVELPGVGLPAGRYLFRLPDATNAHDVVQVLSADGKTVYGMFLTIPDERVDPTGRPEVRFMETRAGDPLPIRGYWMGDQLTGREFVYPKEQALRLAKNSREPVLTTQAHTTKTDETHTSALARVSTKGTETKVAANAKPKAMTPTGRSQQGELAPASIAIAAARIPPRQDAQVARATLPKTGSDLPFIALAGACLIALGGVVRARRRTTQG
jgi:LPXTG-motif cell wall-anchored protein